MDADNIAVRLTNLAQLIDSDMKSDETLTDMQFWALSQHPVGITDMDRRAVAGRLRDHVTGSWHSSATACPSSEADPSTCHYLAQGPG
jgi:hypothetical protein